MPYNGATTVLYLEINTFIIIFFIMQSGEGLVAELRNVRRITELQFKLPEEEAQKYWCISDIVIYSN